MVGEGAGAIILEELSHAIKRDAKIYCEVSGFGLSSDAYHLTAPHPDGAGAYKSMANAIKNSGLPIDSISYVNAHATSTKLGDEVEAKALARLFGEHVYKINVSSTKSMTGHLLGAAGAVESIFCILAVYNDIIPPTINHFNDDPQIDNRINFTFNKAQKREVFAAMNNSFGFGGHNCSIIFKKFEK